MTSLNTLTGRLGALQVGAVQVARTTQWAVNPTLASTNEWGDSDSEGYTNRAAGRRDATFTAEGKYSTTDEQFDLFQPEDVAIAVLWMNRTDLYWDFPRALCNDFSMTINIDSEEVIGWVSGWGADGIYYYPGKAGATSRSFPT